MKKPLHLAWITCCLLLLGALVGALEPGERVDVAALELETLGEGLRRFGPQDLPLIVAALDSSDAFSEFMWRDEASLRGLLQALPPSASVLFLSHARSRGAARREAQWMRDQLEAQAVHLGAGSAAAAEALRRLHYAVAPASRLGGWLPEVLRDWQTPRRLLLANVTQPVGRPGLRSTRLDAAYDWIPWPVTGIRAPLALAGTDCGWVVEAVRGGGGLNGSVALILLTAPPGSEGGCGYGTMLRAAEAAGAVAALFVAPEGAAVSPVACGSDAECGLAVGIPATTVPHSAGAALAAALAAGGEAVVAFAEEDGPGTVVAGVDAHSRLFEVGWLKFPSLLHVAYTAQWEEYLAALERRLARPALEVPVFERAVRAAAAAGGAGTGTASLLRSDSRMERWI